MENTTALIIKGLTGNIVITLLASLLPLMVGIGSIFLSKVGTVPRRITKSISVLTESLAPIIVVMFVFYVVNVNLAMSRELVCIIGFSVCFLGYFPARFNKDYSVGKNIAVNTLGLISTIFKWSFTAAIIGATELLRSMTMIISRTFEYKILFAGVLISFLILAVIHTVKLILEEKMK